MAHRSTPKLTKRRVDGEELRTVLQALTKLALASAAIACGPEDAPAWDPITCTQEGPRVDELHATRALDYLSIEIGYSQRVTGFEQRMTWGSTLVRHGSPCGAAAQPAECEALLREASTVAGCTEPSCGPFAVVGLAGVFERIESVEALRALLGTIDTGDEAVALAAFEGQVISCPANTDALRGTELRPTDGGYELRSEYSYCGDPHYRDLVRVEADGEVERLEHTEFGKSTCVAGRRPPGLVADSASRSETAVGAFLAQAAGLEAASVFAFRMLADALRALGAPEALIARAQASSVDEVRHARDVGRLARRFGARLSAPELRSVAQQGALELAIDNAVEGCVRETFGALIATYQAQTARDPQVRSVMQQIAEDETRHAQLSWELAAWLDTQLSEEQRAHVARERAQAQATLWGELDVGLDSDACATLGYPTPPVCAQLLRGLSEQLWS
jgi:hypothetical protein